MRSKLITEGKLVTYGIYFDVNKDVVKPESYGTIKGIADVLKENPTVNVKIVGHTDSDGDDKSNLDLSKRRAASVKDALVNSFGIDAARIETDGKGEGESIAPNDSGVNKALNRRVEILKL
jgi:outer membrane protein OmpA-like peptidoglycan-associated protein